MATKAAGHLRISSSTTTFHMITIAIDAVCAIARGAGDSPVRKMACAKFSRPHLGREVISITLGEQLTPRPL